MSARNGRNHTPNQKFGKVEYFGQRRLTGFFKARPDGQISTAGRISAA
jgi:hypothetical protein